MVRSGRKSIFSKQSYAILEDSYLRMSEFRHARDKVTRLKASSLSGDELMLRRAKDLGDWLLPAFSTRGGFPQPQYLLGTCV